MRGPAHAPLLSSSYCCLFSPCYHYYVSSVAKTIMVRQGSAHYFQASRRLVGGCVLDDEPVSLGCIFVCVSYVFLLRCVRFRSRRCYSRWFVLCVVVVVVVLGH